MPFAKSKWLALKHVLLSPAFRVWARVAILVLAGIPLLYSLSVWVRQRVAKRYSAHHGMLAAKIVFYPGLIIIVVSVLDDLHFKTGSLLGAAGIAGLAIGFASQTSVSNIISGIFLLAEKPFAVDDVISIGDTTGRVLSIDMLSVKLRTLDNRFVRIPNEVMIKTAITNVSRFPIRRADIRVAVAAKEDPRRVEQALLDVARNNSLCLKEPQPEVVINGIGKAATDLSLNLWVSKENWTQARNDVQREILARFAAEGIELA
jgi:small-conductance mechanosensitive channel